MKILFASHHFYLDQSNGASISTRELLRSLTTRGWRITTFCGSAVDNPNNADVEKYLELHGIKTLSRNRADRKEDYWIESFRDGNIDSCVFRSKKEIQSTTQKIDSDAGAAFLRQFDAILKQVKPDVVVTYGGDWTGQPLLTLSQKNGAKTVVFLHNLAYYDAQYFTKANLTIVPSQYASEIYRKRLRISTVAIPPLIDWKTVESKQSPPDEHKYLLFVNPSRAKGIYLFVRIIKDLWKIRPEIPILVVEGSSNANELRKFSGILSGVKSVNFKPNTPRPRDYYRKAKITLVPSFCDETFGRVAAESLIANVPVVASNRGALPETLGDATILLDIPQKYSSLTNLVPSSSVAQPWIKAILNLWDNAELYAKAQERGRERARHWDHLRILDNYEQVLKELINSKDV